jgi:DNA (cytosine-5)-methyltransferase 1
MTLEPSRHTHTHTHTHDFSVDVIAGGFPCQDISVAGKGAGITGSRSGLWNDFARIIRAIQPRWVVIENVPAITARGLSTVLGDLAEIGFDAEWHCLSASSVGAPHRRERMWIVAHTNGSRCQQQRRPVTVQTKQLAVERCDWWSVEPELGRVANGLPGRVDRLRCLGNAVVPQVVEVIGRAIMQAEEMIGRDSATTQQRSK